MRRVPSTLLVLCFLMAQGAWIDHRYHHHDADHDEVCEICLLGHAQGQGIVSLPQNIILNRGYAHAPSQSASAFIEVSRSHYLSRAPPVSI
ncbi:MAG: hypothetical protein G8D61_18360 [gamma proteobacterium symbiont of Ctena orbiculata]